MRSDGIALRIGWFFQIDHDWRFLPGSEWRFPPDANTTFPYKFAVLFLILRMCYNIGAEMFHAPRWFSVEHVFLECDHFRRHILAESP